MSKSIVLLSTYDSGGAGEAFFRITYALRNLGYNALLLVKHKTKNEPFVLQVSNSLAEPESFVARGVHKVYNKISYEVDQLLKRKRTVQTWDTDPDYYFYNADENIEFVASESIKELMPAQVDLIVIGWASYFINTNNMRELSLATQAPVYWLTTDMEPMTGGCHYAWNCSGYTKDCSNCPAIVVPELKQKAHHNLKIKLKNLQEGNIKVLAGSEWCRQQALNSTLFQNQDSILLLNGLIDQNIFNNHCRDIAKQVFGLSNDVKLIFTGSTFTRDRRKGIDYLVKALQHMHSQMTLPEQAATKIMVAGNYVLENEFVQQIPFEVIPVDFIKDDRLLSLAYQAADLFVCSSIEDSGPMMVNEALACGTPVVGFDLGFVASIVQHGQNGFRVPLKNTQIMAEYMLTVLKLISDKKAEFSLNAIRAIDDNASLTSLQKAIINLLNGK
jgi:glycosyltransferase involved in cell wall biosynthesis